MIKVFRDGSEIPDDFIGDCVYPCLSNPQDIETFTYPINDKRQTMGNMSENACGWVRDK